jgi:nitric oxide dioxygenase
MGSKPMSASTVKTLKATAPVVKEYGTQITGNMYEIMFSRYPEVKNIFNVSHFNKKGDSLSVAPQVIIAKKVSMMSSVTIWRAMIS